MSGLIGKKIGMTSVFNEEGKNIPCTVIEAGPCVVTQVKTVEKDGYSAVQIAYDDKAEKNTNKCLLGHFKKAGVAPKRKMAEFGSFEGELNLGDVLTVDVFEDNDWVDVTGISKGKGFQGVVKRHGFARCRRPDPRPTQPSAQTRFAGCVVLPLARVQGQAPAGPDGRRPGQGAQPAYPQEASREQPASGERLHSRRQRFILINRRLRWK